LISLILTASDDTEALTRLLSALVPGAAEGLVREVAVLGASDLCHAIIADAGADAYPAGAFADAFERAKGPWVCGLPLASGLAPDWIEALAAHIVRDPSAAARLVSRRLWPMTRLEGWLVPKAAAVGALAASTPTRPCEQDLQRLARRSGRRLRVLTRR
jgi:hypothetical protein